MSDPPFPASQQSEEYAAGPLTGAACAAMFVFGIVMALIGAILPALASRLELQVADIGTLFLAMNGAMLAASLALGVVMDRFGVKGPLALGSFVVATALMVVARAGDFGELAFAASLLGAGGGALNAASNTLIADLHKDPRRKTAALNLLGVFFGFGALFLPFAMGALLARVGIVWLLAGCAALCAVAGIFAAALRYPLPKQRAALPVAEIPRFLRSPVVLAFACMLFFESGVEFTLGGFISTYLTRTMAVSSVSAASWILSGYWASLMISRAVLSRVALGTEPFRILAVCSLGACAGSACAAAAPTAGVAALAIAVCGWSLAGIYPTALGIVGARFQSHSGTVFGMLFAIALTGGMLLPWAAGRLGEAAGLRWVFLMVAGCFAAVLVLSRVARRA